MARPALRTVLRAIAAASAATVAVMFVYAAVQQTYRTAADDPQVQIAGDAAAALRDGAPVAQVVPAVAIDMATSLAPVIVVYDAENRPFAGSGRLDGALPTPPGGVLDLARREGSHRVSWRPRPGVRMAAVCFSVGDESGRVVLAARSLREAEERQSRLLLMSALAWGVLLAAVVAAAVL